MIHFAPPDPLLRMVAEQKKGMPSGVYSICSANPTVIEACLRQALPDGQDILIEATCNQVNQFGGRTGMTPAGFASAMDKSRGMVRDYVMADFAKMHIDTSMPCAKPFSRWRILRSNG